MPMDQKISRRAWLTKVMLLTAAAGTPPTLASATEGKVSKSVVHYRNYPKGNQMCGNCKFFLGGPGYGHGYMMGPGMMGGYDGYGPGGMMGGGMMGGMMAGDCQVVEGRIKLAQWAGATYTLRAGRDGTRAAMNAFGRSLIQRNLFRALPAIALSLR